MKEILKLCEKKLHLLPEEVVKPGYDRSKIKAVIRT